MGEAIPKSENLAPDSGHIYARGVETCPRFRAHLCTGGRNMPQIQGTFMHGGRNMPQIQGTFMHGGQKHAPDSGQVFAHQGMACPKSQA